MLLVEGEVGILAAMKAGRLMLLFKLLVQKSMKKTGGQFEVTDPKLMPKEL